MVYKKIDLIVDTFSNELKDKLLVIGDGPDRKIETVTFLGRHDEK